MATALALAIGLNAVNPEHYAGWSGELKACEADAKAMSRIATSQKFKITTLLTKEATRAQVIDKIQNAAKTLKSGDVFMLSYSGHGGQIPDKNKDEVDAYDETWCLYDGELIDDEIYKFWGKFAQGVRILVFSDSCHSGTVTKQAYYRGIARARDPGAEVVKYRAMPIDIAINTYYNNEEFYDGILKDKELKGEARAKVKASILLISGCQDNQFSLDGTANGLFTSQLLQVWKDGRFRGTYRDFYDAIVRRMPPDQTPNYFLVGQKDPKFEAQKPFTI